VINGDVKLPSQEDMKKVAAVDELNWQTRFGYDSKRVKGLVDFQVYCDGIAKIIGVMPPLRKLFFTKPWVWFKIMFGPFTMHQYRLVGPQADPKRAEEVFAKQPVGDLLETSITASYLMLAKFLSFFGFSRFKPNEF